MATPFHPFRSEQDKAAFHSFYLERAKAWPLPSENRFVDTPSGQTFVRVSGRSTDPPLVVLPGARGTSLMWARQISALSAHHRTYAADLITDIGLCTPRRDFKTPDDLVEWLDEVFDALEPERPLDLMGLSYGGWLSALYAFRFPHRVRRVVLLAPGGAVHRLSLAFCLHVALLCVPIPFRRKRDRPTTLQRILRWMFADSFRSGEAGRAQIEWMTGQINAASRHYAKTWMTWSTVLRDEQWKRFRVPGLLIVGENEKIYSARRVKRRMDRVAPSMRTEIIPGVGHDLLLKGDLVVERILAFLDETVPGETVETGAAAGRTEAAPIPVGRA